MQLLHTLDSHLELQHNGVNLFRYVYRPQVPADEAPRPYFHPLRTLKGNLVSGFRPHDHRWHHGLSFTCAHLSGHNFWGGPTYLRDEGYRQLENVGFQSTEVLNLGFSESGCPSVLHITPWHQAGTGHLLGENRRMSFETHAEHWVINFSSQFKGRVKKEPLIWGSPTTQGRENAGYGGLFWRGPRDFLGGKILMSDNREGPDLMGERSPWLAYIGQHDESGDHSTLVFIDDSKNIGFPTPWFVRNTTPMVCPNFFFHEEYVQQPGEILSLNYKILIADGAWSRERIESEVGKSQTRMAASGTR